jgi:hypothetical protein
MITLGLESSFFEGVFLGVDFFLTLDDFEATTVFGGVEMDSKIWISSTSTKKSTKFKKIKNIQLPGSKFDLDSDWVLSTAFS